MPKPALKPSVLSMSHLKRLRHAPASHALDRGAAVQPMVKCKHHEVCKMEGEAVHEDG